MSRVRNTQSLPLVHSLLVPWLVTLSFTRGFAVGLAHASQVRANFGEAKSLWPSVTSFTTHWHIEHASALQTEWTTLALWGNISIQDLAWEILGVDLEETPLPRAPAALPTIPKVMPDRRGGHIPRIYGSPWHVHRPAVPYYRALPLSHPPPSHVLPSLNAPQRDLCLVHFYFNFTIACCEQVLDGIYFYFIFT